MTHLTLILVYLVNDLLISSLSYSKLRLKLKVKLSKMYNKMFAICP